MFGTAYRLGYRECRDLLAERVTEPAPARIQLLSGPRQVGKTTLLLEALAWSDYLVNGPPRGS